jgi:hypothetical protein
MPLATPGQRGTCERKQQRQGRKAIHGIKYLLAWYNDIVLYWPIFLLKPRGKSQDLNKEESR